MSGAVKILQITSYPPPRAGWGVRVEFLKKRLEAAGHSCVVLNIGRSRTIPSTEYETVLSGADYVRKVWRFCRQGYAVHMHVNGESMKGFVLSLIAECLSLLCGRRCFLTFHGGVDQIYFRRSAYPALWPMYWVMFAIPRSIVCNSDSVKSRIVEFGVSPQKVVPIPAFSSQYMTRVDVALPPEVERFYGRLPQVVFTYVRIRPGFYLETMIEGFARVAATNSSVGLAVCGVSGDVEPMLMKDLEGRIARHGLGDRICLIDDLTHDQFLEALSRSALYLRTPTTDGVASSVLEALALGVPVVGAENGTRPSGVVTYSAADDSDLAAQVSSVLEARDTVVASLTAPEMRDTLAEEVAVLTA